MQYKRKEFIVVLTLGLLTALGPFSIDMYLPAFPTLALALNSSIEHIQLSLTSFFIGISFGQLIYGPITDRFGRKKPLIFGLAIYVLASLGSLWVHNAEQLIALRFIQALGACAGMVVSRAMVRDIFPLTESAKVFSMLMLVMGIAPIVAPTVGGFMLKLGGWQAIFLTLAVISFSMLLMTFFVLPESKAADSSIQLKLSSVIKEYGEVIQNSIFLKFSVLGSLVSAGLFSYIAGSPFLAMKIYKISAENYGLLFGLNAIGIIGGSQVNRLLLKRFESIQIIKSMAIVMIICAILLPVSAYFNAHMTVVLTILFCFISCYGFINPNASAIALSPFSKNAGFASALLGSLQMLFGVLASACISFFHNGTAMPMMFIISVCGVCVFFVSRIAVKEQIKFA
ncbi:Bcr/CflA family drug resistance efflux transporter [Solitalea longa]|uniref:Bcr/CflA family drug resistance efflux transporter n=1 Tax=Solitalea longa TaxID=2079460 RepID=A0A2S5A5F7_9SPHI|nr:multidrug effflux MFS transporter [Solitalea longa]POY37539.1 Bcr/CflA family drug resistance efflux transporter [Solitalea longa]